jgi:hypothetical protein
VAQGVECLPSKNNNNKNLPKLVLPSQMKFIENKDSKYPVHFAFILRKQVNETQRNDKVKKIYHLKNYHFGKNYGK